MKENPTYICVCGIFFVSLQPKTNRKLYYDNTEA